MIQFILNDRAVSTSLPPGTLLLDYIRYHQHLNGTKIGCREGDCGACTILTGELQGDEVRYRSATSCLLAIGSVQGKHIVTIEGVNLPQLNLVQQAFADEGATQCGFCTPGFIVSAVGYCLTGKQQTGGIIDAVNGNICRCTGYKSIERALSQVESKLTEASKDAVVSFAIQEGIVPSYFATIPAALRHLHTANGAQVTGMPARILGGGTDLYVQRPEEMIESRVHFTGADNSLRNIEEKDGLITVGGAVTLSDIAESPIFQSAFPPLQAYIKLISSTQIRNMATVSGNLVNASPIGDLSIFFLALDASVELRHNESSRVVALRNFFLGYKVLDMQAGEHVTQLMFKKPVAGTFNFEKVSKRTWLDIASVNTACILEVVDGVVREAAFSAGGVGPVPMYLPQASASLVGKEITADNLETLIAIAQSEISPISDVRGTAGYKRLLLGQLIKAHVMRLQPSLPDEVIS